MSMGMKCIQRTVRAERRIRPSLFPHRALSCAPSISSMNRWTVCTCIPPGSRRQRRQWGNCFSSRRCQEEPWQRAKAICALTSRTMQRKALSNHRTAADAMAAGGGERQRFCAGISLPVQAFRHCGPVCQRLSRRRAAAHAWAEVYCDDIWRALDPSTGKPVEEGYLKIAHGPDYDACAVERSCFRERDTDSERQVHVQVTEHVIHTRDTVPHA